MGASNSRPEEDKSLQLCRARKKFVKQALNGRCSLAAAHIAYIEELKIIGIALRRFVEVDAVAVDEPYVHPSRTLTPEPRSLKSVSRSSFSSQTQSQNVESTSNLSPSFSTPVSSNFQSHRMKFRGAFSRKVEEKPAVAAVGISVDSAYHPPTATPPVTEPPEPEPEPEAEPEASEEAPWDYFGLFDSVDNHFSSQESRGFDRAADNLDEVRHPRVETGVSEIEEEKLSFGIDESQESEDEFDEPSSDTLVRSFTNVNREKENVSNEDSHHISLEDTENGIEANKKVVNGGDSPTRTPEIKPVNGKKNNSPDLSPLRPTSSRFVHLNDVKLTPMKQSEAEEAEDLVAPKDFSSSMKEIELLFVRASEAGKEVPRMLEANKFHFRPVYPGKELGSSLLKSCFSCGEDPSAVPQEPPQDSVKYLTWHRTTSSRSASSRNLLGANSIDGIEDVSKNLFDDFCMVSGSHASTLDRLYAWEKKLYDEVKASQVLRSSFDQKCKLLRQLESREQSTDKTRAAVKALHSRIRVAVQRINYISKKIEEIRDKELQPQLEELIEGLRKMWEMMVDCHKLQFHIISVSQAPGSMKIAIQSDSRKHITIQLGNELSAFSSVLTKGITAQKLYVEAIDNWLLKCVVLPKNPSRRSRRQRPPEPIRHKGPPIYMICGTWLEMIKQVPSKAVIDSIKDLASEVSHFLPRQEKKGDPVLKDEVSDDHRGPAMDRFRTSLAGFLGQLNNCAEFSVKMFSDLQKVIQEAKNNYGQHN